MEFEGSIRELAEEILDLMQIDDFLFVTPKQMETLVDGLTMMVESGCQFKETEIVSFAVSPVEERKELFSQYAGFSVVERVLNEINGFVD